MKIFENSLFVIFLAIFSLACSQNTKTNNSKTKVELPNKAIPKENKPTKTAKTEQAKLPKPYHPKENAEQKISELVKQAQKENKNIIIQAGGNWCIWCLRFNHFVHTEPRLKAILEKNYLYYHLNFSPENKNEKIFAKYGNPGEQYGYPVLLVLDKNGTLIHTQETGQLEKDKGYDIEKVHDFFQKWIPKK